MNRIMLRCLRLLRSLLIAAAAALLIWTIVLMIFEEKFIYFPHRYPRGPYDQARSISGLRDCWMMTEDSVRIHGWFVPVDNATATFVIAHGNAGNISHRYMLLRSLQRHGYNALMFDYRGYGRSDGSPSEEGIYKDGRAAFDYALTLPEVHRDRIFLWGTSLGGAVAVDVATHRRPCGMILESTFTSAADLAGTVYPFLPVRFLMRTKLNSIGKIQTLHIPLLVIHGSQDSIVPLALGRRLFNAANQPKEFYEIPEADHNDTFHVGGDSYFSRIDNFASSAPRASH